jgi:redox-sensitive bicupin YhaK (pirin superfamily)
MVERMTGPVLSISESKLTTVGGLPVHRSLPKHERRMVGAWCFLDRFGPIDVTADQTMAVGPHPHIGLHTVTWLLQGEVLHSDSLGNEQPIRPGQLNLMTSGRGIAHAEDGRGRWSGPMDGVQLWVAQPEATRHQPPSFAHHAELPQVHLRTGQATVLIGDFAGTRSPAHTDSALVGVDLVGEGRLELPLDPTFEYAIAVLQGSVRVADADAAPDQLVYLGTGREVLDLALGDRSRLLLLGGQPFAEDIAMWWNFVARNRTELVDAYADWQAEKERFGSVDSSLHRIDAPRPFWLS